MCGEGDGDISGFGMERLSKLGEDEYGKSRCTTLV